LNLRCARRAESEKDIKPVKQILPELLVADHQQQISMRRRDKANIDMNIPANTPETSRTCNLFVIGLSRWE
jgi:hypothetical protein